MHYHMEIIMPPTDDVEEAVRQVMHQFDENLNTDDETKSTRPFWDWWVIGGRWSGHKIGIILGEERIAAFHAVLADRKVTVSGVRAGKPTLQPPEQAELVNRLWNEHFPDAPVRECPLFDNYSGNWGDVLPLAETPQTMTCYHLIIAGPSYEGDELQARYMLQDSIWNGVTYQPTAWDGTIVAGVADFVERHRDYKEKWRAAHIPQVDWLVVTVDYHS
jgi:hypothetical protein